MKSSESVSVIIPCHNDGECIAEALTSVVNQTHPPFEVIVINDHSTDDSLEVAERFKSLLPLQIKSVSLGNAAASRNAGMEVATGRWLAFLDADNAWYPNHLEQAMKMLAGSADCACMSYSGPRDPSGASTADTASMPVDKPAAGLTHKDFIRFRLKASYGFPTTGQVLRRDVVQAIGGFDVSQVRRHDFELFMRTIHSRTWSFNTERTWWSRPPRPGNISSNEVECRYYALRALVLNEPRYSGPVMNRIMAQAARKAVTTALTDGGPGEISRAWDFGNSHLKRSDRLLLSLLCRMPAVSRRFLRIRHSGI